MRKLSIGAAGFAAAFAAFAAPAGGQDLTPEGRGAYAALAGANEAYQLRAAEIALEKARTPALRSHAETMLAEHRDRLARFEETARAAGLEEQLPPAMLPRHWAMLRRLEQRSGSRFERTYVAQQVESHEIAVELHRNFAANGTGPRLIEFARAAAPIAARHLDAARRLGD